MNHYVCSECRTTSKVAGTCQNDDCIKMGTALKECHCEDNQHEGVVSLWKDSENPEDIPEGNRINTLDLDSEDTSN